MQNQHSSTAKTLYRFSYASLIAAALFVGPVSADNDAHAANPQTALQQRSPYTHAAGDENTDTPKIQLAILLDTSSSMDGLIDQTRNQLWQIVNEFSSARKDGTTPILEIALFEYGNDGLSQNSGYIRMLSGFTRELDAVSEGLFSLTTNGGSEYCGYAIRTAMDNLQWSVSDDDIKSIFIAGNESFAQGPVDYRKVAKLAVQRGISINTIHAGGRQQGIGDEWEAGALMAGGAYMSIDADQKVVHIAAPQDKQIAALNDELNSTYIPYGKHGADKALRQMEQDAQSSRISAGLLAKRAKSKSSSFYNNAGWDLVDALREGKIGKTELARIADTDLPDAMKGLSSDEKLEFVRKKTQQRDTLKQEIAELSRQRTEYVAKVKREQAAAAPSMGDALTKAVKKQAEQKDFVFEVEGK